LDLIGSIAELAFSDTQGEKHGLDARISQIEHLL
jgi:hypothetical protein